MAPEGSAGALLDLARLTAWLDDRGIESGEPVEVARLGTGRSNEMFELRRGGRRLVLRRPALVALEGADRGLRREYRMLRALEGTPVPHATPLAQCEDPSVLGAPFYVMDFVDGVMPFAPLLPPALDSRDAHIELTGAVVDVLADLGSLDVAAVGLADFGRPEGFHERQRDRWLGQYHSYGRRELPGIEAAADWLAAHLPGAWTAGIMHGDYHMGNLLVARDRPARVVAVCDWETASIGDPLLDLAAFLRFWTEAHPEAAGWPGGAWIVDRYAARTGRPVPDLTYYSVLARVRLAIMLEGIYQRSLLDPTRPVAEDMHTYALGLLDDLAAMTA